MLEVTLTNEPKGFQSAFVAETGLSDCHKLIISLFNAYFKKLLPKTIGYRSYKKFDISIFLYDFSYQVLVKGYMDLNDDDSYDIFTNVYRSMVDKQALLKSKNIRVY